MMKSKSSLFIQYLLIFSLIAIVPIVTTCLALVFSHNSLTEEVIQSNQSSLELVQQSLDIKIQEFTNIPSLIEQNPSLTKTSLQNNPGNAISNIKEITSAHNFINNIIINIRDSNYFYSSKGTFHTEDLPVQSFMSNLLQNGYSCATLVSMVNSVTTPTFWPVDALEDIPNDLYLFSPVYNTEFQYESQNASRVSIILINREAIHDLFRASQTNSEETILLLNSDKQLLTFLSSNVSTDTIQQICDYIRSSTETAEILRLTINGIDNIIFISQSAQTGLFYVRFLPEHVAYQPIYQMRNISLTILVIALILSVFLVGYGIKRSYVPIRTLADWIQTKQPTNLNARNELLLFKKVFDDTFEQNSNMSELISNSRYGLIDHFLKDLICGNFASEEEFTAACQKLNLPFTRNYYAVACVLVESNSDDDSNIDFNLILDAIRDELPENISIQIKDLLFAGKLIIVLSSDSNDLTTYKKVIVTIKQRLLDHADILTSIGMGSFYDSYEHVGKSYLEATNALDYRLIYGKDCLITQEMCNIDKTELVYPSEDISQLASALLSKDAEAASEAIYRLNAYAKSPHCTLHSAKYICYDTFSVLKKTPPFMNVGYENTGSDNLDITKLTDYDNIDEFFTALHRIVQNAIGTPKAVASESDLGPQLVEYIEQHCFSYNFQVSTIAEHFSISQPSMRKIFREYTGIGISDYVTNIKMEKAMQLLRETDTNVQEIVTAIGNTDASAFIRLFKKKTGMTPGQYRKANRF